MKHREQQITPALRWPHRKDGFTIVELLIVIIVIAVLATITIVAFNGVQDRARASAMSADFSNNNKVVKMASASAAGNYATPLEVLQAGTKLVSSTGIYKLSTFCSSGSGYALAVETTAGNKYYSLNGGAVTQNNSIDVTNACTSLGIASASKYFMGMPSSACAAEHSDCTFSGTATIAYGAPSVGKFNALKDLSSPVLCDNTVFGDPASGYAKACYILSY